MTNLSSLEASILHETLLHGHTCFHRVREFTEADPTAVADAVNHLAHWSAVRLVCERDGETTLVPGTTAVLDKLLRRDLPENLRSLLMVRVTLAKLGRALGPHPGVTQLDDAEDITHRVHAWRTHTRHHYAAVHHGLVVHAERLRTIASQTDRLLERGVRVSLVYPVRHLSPALHQHTEHLRRRGAIVALAHNTTHRLLIMDDARVVLAHGNPGAVPDRAHFIERGELVGAFVHYAHALVESARTHRQDIVARTIDLLASGLKDAAAAKELGVTERQFRRYVSSALEELGSCSRFQAGVEAARRLHLA